MTTYNNVHIITWNVIKTVYQPEHYIQKKIPYMGTKTSNTVNSSLLLWTSWTRSSGILLKQTLSRNSDDHDNSSSIVSV